jgi:signal transduction histidine kinase
VLAPRAVDLTTLVGEGISYVIELAEAKGQRLRIAIDPAAARVWADPQRLKQVVINLVSNAIKFSPKDASIVIGSDVSRAEDHVDLWVSDTGSGIPAADRERIFEPWVMLDPSLGRAGTGLGLALVKRIAELHGGSVRVEDGPATGSKFIVTLPVAAA